LSDGLYGDFGAEHITKPGYERYWQYLKELDVEALPYPRRKNLMRRIGGKFYSEKMLRDPEVLKNLAFNSKEIHFLSQNPYPDLVSLYVNPYLDKFTDEYQPFGVGLDHMDQISMSELFKRDGASPMALGILGGENTSALHGLWYSAILKMRGVPNSPVDLYRLKGGNQMLPNAFAKKLGSRVWLNCPISAIEHNREGVTVKFSQFNEERELHADYLVNCIPLTALNKIQFTPAFSTDKQYVIDNIEYDSYQRFVFQASSKFWEKDGLSINMDFDHPDLWAVWHSADEVDSHRVIVLGTGPGGISVQRALATFRELYPGSRDTIEQAVSRDWTKEAYSSTCERISFPPNSLQKFWPEIINPEGRIYFAGAYADNLNWGMEASTRSGYRAASQIDQA
jgi:monoamine oxidase